MKIDSEKSVILLLSGGIDSTACLHYYVNLGVKVKVFFIDFGQPAKRKELVAARRIAKNYKLKLNTIKAITERKFSHGEIPGRNIFLISAAFMSSKNFKGIISMGIHAGTDYPDCSPTFVKIVNNLLGLYSNGTVVFEAPFLKMNKIEIAHYCLGNKIAISSTYSCELGLDQPCGKCLSCKDLKRIYDFSK